tara:strand:- start:3028 stop:5130 length:2103 start_codon:yes stop_codon:yes gene_type:complete
MIKIATILPYKENYTYTNAGAAALWVRDFFKYSKYKKNNYIFGSTLTKDYLTKNYINVNLKNNSKFSSATIQYCNSLIKKIKNKYDIVEIHNRPLVFIYLKKQIDSKFIIHFHNDPLSMKGSKTVKERLFLLKNANKIIFISKWVQKRFFEGIDQKLIIDTDVIYHSIDKEKRLSKKNNNIVFVGKLNPSKGYDIYRDAVIKILNEFKNWKAYSIGDEKRNKPIINHDRHFELGYLKQADVLKFLKKSEIAVVPSRWEEPFGRTSLEASSRGCATIISGRGGLSETTDHCVTLNKLTPDELYKEIKKLILNKSVRKKLQIEGLKNVKHITKNTTIYIDNIRKQLVDLFKINYNKNKIRILNIYNVGQKLNHRLYNISLGKKFTNGFIRNGHDVLEISDRDFIKQNRQLSFLGVYNKFQSYLIETFKNYNPNFIFFGHTNNISLETFDQIKNLSKNLTITQWNEDPIMPGLEVAKKNLNKISYYKDYVDHTFITTDPKVFKKQSNGLKNVHFLFVPVDKNIECYDVFNLTPRNDLFYALSHGVNRATLKTGNNDPRIHFLNSLINKINGISYDFYGFENKEPIWGTNFYKALINSKMGLNLSRGIPTKYYSSNRIASLMGNGLLTFIDKKTLLNDIFNSNELIFYNNINDLADKIIFYKNKDEVRKKIARNGKNKYFKLFNEKRISNYIVQKSFGKDFSLL